MFDSSFGKGKSFMTRVAKFVGRWAVVGVAIWISLPLLGAETEANRGASDAELEAALGRAGSNRGQLDQALERSPAEQRPGLRFLIANMPERDLRGLSAEFLLENCDLAYRAWRESPWQDQIPEDVFFDSVLPYASINERRDAWRKQFLERFRPMIAEAKTPSQAAALLNQKVFPEVKVKYSTARRKADQSPLESIESGLASCSGLSVLLIDACRAVGVPARFVGTPLWADRSGNHSWVEVWDNGWHFTGAAEPTGDKLNQAWFTDRASTARRDEPIHAIYAATFRRTPLNFPLVWDRSIDYVYAVNVTERYLGRAKPVAEGERRILVKAVDSTTKRRVAAELTIRDGAGESRFQGTSKDERFDANDHVTADLRDGQEYVVEAKFGGQKASRSVRVDAMLGVVTLEIAAPPMSSKSPPEATPGSKADSNEPPPAAPNSKPIEAAAVDTQTLRELQAYLAQESRGPLAEQPFATRALTKAEALQATRLLWKTRTETLRRERADEMQAKTLKLGDLKMPFDYRVFGKAPAEGRSLYISMHGGGGAPKGVNDQQWENQKRLYQPQEGVYVAPRAPTDTWNLWHQEHIDPLFDRLIENLVVFEQVDPNKVYLMGYSAGGDGVYQVAPRMADRFAAASMMAGHPNESTPKGLRNLPFAIFMGGKDAAYNRNQVAQQWGEQLGKLRGDDPQGYEHLVKIFPEKGHWMDREDAMALPWMAKFRRNPFPPRVVWRQDDVTERRFYWLAAPANEAKGGTEIVAQTMGQRIELQMTGATSVVVRLSDSLMDLDQPISIVVDGQSRYAGPVKRTIKAIDESLAERADPSSVCVAMVSVAPVSATDGG